MEDPWKPDHTFKFPASGKRNLKFQYNWMTKWNWLLYSKIEDGAFCKYCLLFSSGEGGRGSQSLGVLVKKPFNQWKDAIDQFKYHESTSYHKTNALKASVWSNVEAGNQPSVELLQNTAMQQQILQNRKSILPIIETVIFCGRQGIALRAHRDHGDLDLNDSPIENEGNFRALLRFRACSGDDDLKNHLETGSKNALYLSPKIQNEVISACNEIILKKVVDMINFAQCFTVLADETTDISTEEQLSIGVRYIYGKHIKEDFLQFVPVHDLKGKGLASVIVASLAKFGINTKYLRGQGYDGASAMSGKFIGAQAHVQDTHPMAIYVHCASHSLNLAISTSCSVTDIRNCCAIASKIYVFFNTPKRCEVLKKSICEKCPDTKATRLKQMCPTRWVERHDSILQLEEILPAIHYALEEISTWEDSDTSSSAIQLCSSIKSSAFLISLHILAKVFSLSLPLCRSLQLENVDLLAAVNMVNQLKDKIQEIRINDKTEFSIIFNSAKAQAELFGTNLIIPRLASRQTHRFNLKTDSSEDYFRISVFLPFLDHFSNELNLRFLKHQKLLGSFMCLLPEKNCAITNIEEDQMKYLITFYAQDVQCSDTAAIGELHMWYEKLKELNIYSRQAMKYFVLCNEDIFPTIHKLLKILITLPVSTCTSERSFSTLRRLKTYLRNSTGQQRLNGLAMLNIHREVIISPEEVLNEMAKSQRRLEFRLS